MKNALLVFVCLFTPVILLAQLPRMNMFYENFSWQNPSFTADEYAKEIMLQSQFQNFTPGSANSTLLLNFEESLKIGGIGINYFGNYFQQNQEHALQLNYAYHLKLTEITTLSGGVSAGAYLWRFDQGALIGNGNSIVWNSGLRLKTGNWLVAFSNGQKAGTNINPQSSLMVHYEYALADELKVIPTVYALSRNGQRTFEGIGARLVLFGNFEIGLFGASQKGFYFTSGVTIANKFRFGYSLSNLAGRTYRFPSQELFLAIKFE